MAMIPRFWRPQLITDEERLERLEHTVEPQALNFLLYMTNGMTAVLHPLLQSQNNGSFVPALIACCSVVYGLSTACIVFRRSALFYRRGLRMILFSLILWAITTVKFELAQTFILLPIIIDVGGLLACQDSLSV